MRKKQSILLYCADVNLLSATGFALRLHGYEIVAVRDVREAIAMVNDTSQAFACCVLIHARQADPTGRLSHLLLQRCVPMPLLLIDRVGDLAPMRYIDTVLYGRNTGMVHVLAALHAMLTNSRIGNTRPC